MNVPPGEALTYRIPIPVDSTGTLIVNATWPGTRVLSFRLVGPSGLSRPFRRSGPSPQILKIDVDDAELFGEWNLTVNGLAVRGGGEGRLAIHLPTTVIAEPAAPAPSPEKPAPTPKRKLSADGLPEEWSSFAKSAVGFAELLVEHLAPDAAPHFSAGFTPGERFDVYGMMIRGFSFVPSSIFYIIAIVLLCSHLGHGVASIFQTLGLRTHRNSKLIGCGSQIFAWVICAGFVSIPLAVMLKIVTE